MGPTDDARRTETSSGNIGNATNPEIMSSSRREDVAARSKPIVSELAKVGALNNAASVSDVAAAETEVDPVANTDALDSSDTATKTPDTDDEAPDEPDVQPENPPKPKANSKPAKPKPIKEPFADLPKAVALPSIDDTQARLLAETKLPARATVQIRLVGGLGAHAQNEFQLVTSSKRQWDVTVGESNIARLNFRNGKLFFAWQADQETASVAPHLANTVLVLKYGDERHALALRKYQRMSAIPVNLERRKPYDFKIDYPPDPEDVMLEFVPSNDSLAVALPNGIIGDGQQMRIGLDAGKNSLFVLQVEPNFRGRKQSLSTRASVRRNPRQAQFSAVKPGLGASLRTESRAAARNLFQLKAARKRAENDVKKRLDRRIKVLEENKKRMESFVESYLLAAQSKLQFRIYRQVGNHRIPLIALED